MATLSTETQAIIDRLVREGELLRNDGAHSIKSVKETITVEFAKFAAIFDQMKGSLAGLSKTSAANLVIAQEDAKLRGLTAQERLDYLRKQSEMEQRKQELENQRLKREEDDAKDDANKKEKGPGLLKTMAGFFSGIKDFFKKAALLLAGGVIAYEFIAGMIEEKFDIKIPTVIEGFKKLGEFLKLIDWTALGNAILSIIAVATGFKIALGLLSVAISALAGIKILGSLLPGGRPPIIIPPPTPVPPGSPPGARYNSAGRLIGPDGRFITTPTPPPPPPPPPRPGLVRRVAGQIANVVGGNKAKAALTIASMAGVGYVNGGTDNTTLDATAGQEDLLAAINERDTSLMGVLSETASSAVVGGALGGTLGAASGLLTGGVTAVPGAMAGAITGAISGAVWGFATTVALGAKRAFDDMGEGVDELPNSVEEALREEKAAFEAGMEGRVEAIKATAQAAEEFLKQNQSKLEEKQKEIASIQSQLESEGTNEGLKSSLRARLDGLNTDLELLQRQSDVSENILQRKKQELENQIVLPAGTNIEQLGKIIETVGNGGNGASGAVVINKQGDVTNLQTTNMNKSNAVSYRQNMHGFGGGSGSRWEAIPGMFG